MKNLIYHETETQLLIDNISGHDDEYSDDDNVANEEELPTEPHARDKTFISLDQKKRSLNFWENGKKNVSYHLFKIVIVS